MRQFLASYIRFKWTEIIIFDNSPYTTQHICSLELISYIWKKQTLQLTDWSNNDLNSLNLIYNSSDILRCRTFQVWHESRETQLLQNPHLFRLQMIHYSMTVEKQQLVDIVQQKSTNPESSTVIRLNTFEEDAELQDALNTIRNVSVVL
ncbi:hypothetical protein Ddc_04911 [Ditylenchus destructor]|nr:hypothetical protein Ddc_04911 [Ditylenchus destructor]